MWREVLGVWLQVIYKKNLIEFTYIKEILSFAAKKWMTKCCKELIIDYNNTTLF